MKKIKVCFAFMGAYPLFNRKCSYRHGGAEVRLYTLAKELAKDKRFEVHFIVGSFGQNEEEVYNGIRVYKGIDINKRKVSYLIELLKLFPLMKRIDADIYITGCANILDGIMAYYCKMISKKFIYMTAHQRDVDKSFINNSGIRGRIYKYGLFNNHLIITQNLDHQLLLKMNHDLPSMVMKNPVVIDSPSSELQRNYILWVAGSRKFKQPELFLEIAKTFPQEKFLMVMPKSDPDLFYKTKNEASGINNLTFIEYIPFHRINRLFNKAKVFINTSTQEGFPNTFLQAAVNKTPIVSLNVNPDNFITKYECGYFADGNFSKMIAQLRELISSKEKLTAMGNNALEYAKKNHDVKIIIEQFKTALYQSTDVST